MINVPWNHGVWMDGEGRETLCGGGREGEMLGFMKLGRDLGLFSGRSSAYNGKDEG